MFQGMVQTCARLKPYAQTTISISTKPFARAYSSNTRSTSSRFIPVMAGIATSVAALYFYLTPETTPSTLAKPAPTVIFVLGGPVPNRII